MKVLVTGGRDYDDRDKVFATLDAIHSNTPITLLIEGGAFGADTLAWVWTRLRRVTCRTKRARWAMHGNAAGPLRNRRMVEMQPDLVVAFPGGRGTHNCVTLASYYGLRVHQVR